MASLKLLFLLIACSAISIPIEAFQELNDPTRPSLAPKNYLDKVVVVEQKKQLLTAIFIKKGLKQAIINNKLYKVGEFFGNKKITAIRTNQVVLSNSKGSTRLQLINPLKKRKTH